MDYRQFIVFLSSVGFLLTGCAPDQQLIDQNTVLNTELKHARMELHAAEEKLKKSLDLDAKGQSDEATVLQRQAKGESERAQVLAIKAEIFSLRIQEMVFRFLIK